MKRKQRKLPEGWEVKYIHFRPVVFPEPVVSPWDTDITDPNATDNCVVAPDGTRYYSSWGLELFRQGRRDPRIRFAQRGGCTIAFVHIYEAGWAAYGIAWCNKGDQFNKRIGRMISLGRALKDVESRGIELQPRPSV